LKGLASAQDADSDQHSTATANVNESEVRIVRRFLESVCDHDLFKGFQFDRFFDSKLIGKTVTIWIDPEKTHLKILKQCLQVISKASEENKTLAPLLDYAISYFVTHLMEIDPVFTRRQDRTEVGAQLVRMFCDENVIQRWWVNDYMWPLGDWLCKDTFADVVLSWLKDSAVAKNLNEEEKQ
jgi:hypothetical protein